MRRARRHPTPALTPHGCRRRSTTPAVRPVHRTLRDLQSSDAGHDVVPACVCAPERLVAAERHAQAAAQDAKAAQEQAAKYSALLVQHQSQLTELNETLASTRSALEVARHEVAHLKAANELLKVGHRQARYEGVARSGSSRVHLLFVVLVVGAGRRGARQRTG